jgi:hypothetical protein
MLSSSWRRHQAKRNAGRILGRADHRGQWLRTLARGSLIQKEQEFLDHSWARNSGHIVTAAAQAAEILDVPGLVHGGTLDGSLVAIARDRRPRNGDDVPKNRKMALRARAANGQAADALRKS